MGENSITLIPQINLDKVVGRDNNFNGINLRGINFQGKIFSLSMKMNSS